MDLLVDFLILIILISFAWCGLSIAPFMPTRKKDLQRVNDIISSKKWDKILEIGFWDGRVSRYLAKRNPDSFIEWVELSPVFYLIGQVKQLLSPLKNLKLHLKNGFSVHLSEYDIIYIFAMPDNLKWKLKEKFLKEMKTGAKIVSYSFFIEEWPWETIKNKPDNESLAIYTMIKK